jgi:hypothetical protein
MVQENASDFIEVYPDMVDATTCRAIVNLFAATGAAVPGVTGGGLDTAVKLSWDIEITGRPEWKALEGTLLRKVLPGLRSYVRTYPHLVVAPLSLHLRDPQDGQLRRVDGDDVRSLDDASLNALLDRAFRFGAINVQKYDADSGGYPYWHCEQFPVQHSYEPLHRVLLWTVYLNDGFREGETEFLYQRRRISPRVGSLVIAPSGFTHTHRGNTPRGGDKYIATSWILFQPAERLYGG